MTVLTYILKFTRLIFLVISIGLLSQFGARAAIAATDVRILIDVSSSMAKHDPENLRATSLRLLSRFLPEDTIAGVWIFAQDTKVLIPVGKVDKNWVVDVDIKSNNITNASKRTDIGKALRVATQDWGKNGADDVRLVLLLTDGILDVGDNGLKNDEASAHILQSILPKVVRNKAVVHTIGLSNRANEKFLRNIASKTNGIYENLLDITDLENLFVKILAGIKTEKQSMLERHVVAINKNTKNANILFTKKQSQDNITLISPTQEAFTKAKHNNNISWFNEGLLNVISLDKPSAGDWKVVGRIDPKEEFKIIKNVEFNLNNVPQGIFSGEQLSVDINLMADGKNLTDSKILSSFKFNAQVVQGDETRNLTLVPGDDYGKFNLKLGPFTSEKSEDFNLIFNLKSNTFEQHFTKAITVQPIPINFSQQAVVNKKGAKSMLLELSLQDNSLMPNTATIHANIVDNLGNNFSYLVPKIADNLWNLELVPRDKTENFEVSLQIAGELLSSGRTVMLDTAPLVVLVPDITPPDPIVIEKQGKTIIKEIKLNLSKMNVLGIIGSLIIFNMLLFTLVYFGYKLHKQYKERVISSLSNNFK